MEDLEIKIAVKAPINNLTFNGLLRGLEINRDPIMRFGSSGFFMGNPIGYNGRGG
ncbi:MAG: hypothetical protein IMZ61_15050, partial [Planctomycetes bacterium]|nr:hypothetical protein [Planctomycetota bacterium]